LKRAHELSSQNPEKKLFEMKKREKARETEFQSVLSQLNFSKREQELVSLVREFVFLRNYRVECWVQAQFLLRPFLEQVANRLNLSFEELTALNYQEIHAALVGKEHPDKNELALRLKGYSYVKIREKPTVFFGEKAETIAAPQSEPLRIQNESVLKGKTANKGIAIGTVRVVRELSDLSKVNRGDILVASMTVPQYISAMEKAAAFVTDEGGITCHAAIVSRELNVPCIVGTGIATRVLHDGDEVEVDANKGIVRKIPKQR